MGGILGGSQSTTTKNPAWVDQAAQQALAQGRDVARIGYVPYSGPDVAAFTPAQQAAFDSANLGASAFGLPSGASSMPAPQTFAGGVQGYSAAPMFQQALEQLKATAPGQYQAIVSQFIDPVTGQMAGQPQQMRQPQQMQRRDRRDRGPQMPVTASGQTGGYRGLLDMFDGGGAGASGNTFSGGGLLSTVANRRFTPWGSR